MDWHEPLHYSDTWDEETGQRLPNTDLNGLCWHAGDLVEYGIEFHIAECTEPEHPGYVLRQRGSDGALHAWSYCIPADKLVGFFRGIHFSAEEITERQKKEN
jgi:hypothetical protein